MSATILLVDDEPDMCWALEHILRKRGFETDKTTSGQEALQLMQSCRYAVVFLDAKLTDMDGLDLSRRLRQINPGISIIMVSGYFYRDDIAIQTAIAEGLIQGFISKPFVQGEIIEIVTK